MGGLAGRVERHIRVSMERRLATVVIGVSTVKDRPNRASESQVRPPQYIHSRAQPGLRFRRHQPLDELQQAHDRVRGAVAPRCLELQLHLPCFDYWLDPEPVAARTCSS